MGYNLNLNTIIDTIFKLFADSFLIRETEDKYEIFEISSKQHARKKIRIVFSAPMYRKIQIGNRKDRDSSAQNDISKCILIAEEKRIKNNKNGEKGTIEALLELVEKTTRDFFDLERHITETFINALKLERLIVEDDECIRNKKYVKKEKIEALTLLGEELNMRLKDICSEIQNMVLTNMSNLLFEYHTYIEQSTMSSWISALVVTSLLNDNLVCETKFSDNVDRVEKNIVDYLLAKKCIEKIESNDAFKSNDSPNIQTQFSSIKEEQGVSEKLTYDTSSYIDVLFAKFIHSLNGVYEIKDVAEIEKCQRIIIRGAENFFHATYLSGYDKMNELRNAFQQVRIKIEQINGQYSEAISTMIEICSITLEIKLLDAEIKRMLDAMKRADEDLYKLERVKNMLENERLEMIELKNDLTRDLSTLINSESLGRHLVFKDKGDGN